jgi:hypothetical protein
MLSILSVTVVLKNDGVKECRKLGVAGMTASIATDAGVNVLAAGEDASLERNARIILGIFQLTPDFLSQVLGDKTLGASRELRESGEVLSLLKMGSTLDRYVNSTGSKFFLFCDHSFDTIVHILDEINFGSTESTFVGDVVDVVVSFSMLTVGTSNLDVEMIGDLLELFLVLSKEGQVDVDRSAKGSATICGAGGDVTEILSVGEFGNLLNLSSGTGKSAENFTDVGTLLHRDDT